MAESDVSRGITGICTTGAFATSVAELSRDPVRAKRYERLRAELFAWNALESSVALAVPASFILLVAELR
jgi:hypothetical protein